MDLLEQVARAFAADGALALATDHYREREGQTRMAVAVAQTISEGGALVAEAGTGVGKTYSYLVPALLSGERVLVSTATKALQDQLFSRDLPAVASALNLPVRSALLKGRGSYLCLHRMEAARQDASLPDRTTVHALARIERWAQSTRTGDLAELPGLDERSPLIPLVTSTRENCLGSQCPKFKACHVNLARREALAADVVVINHHLFFADLAVRESGMAELLPSVRVAIFDEAHQLNETGVQFLGVQLTTGQLLDVAHDMLGAGLQLARGLADWQGVAGAVERSARDLRLAAGRSPAGGRQRWTAQAPEGTDPGQWSSALENVRLACADAVAALNMLSEIAPDFVRLHERVLSLQTRAAHFLEAAAMGTVRWVDAGQQLRLVESPLDIAKTVREKLLRTAKTDADVDGDADFADSMDAWLDELEGGNTEGASQAGESAESADAHSAPHSWIFTSATLGDDAGLTWFTEPCGLEDARIVRVESPFDYPSQASLYVPRDLPKPNEPGHAAQVAQLAATSAAQLGGRTMVLTTTLRSLREIGESLQRRFADDASIEVLVQGQWPKRRLMERLREGNANGQAGCLLVASASFWEGIDIPGEALQLVIIDKLPFPPPGDPLVEARSLRLQSQGRSPFGDYSVPEAAVALKQGAGRLIRRESDMGVLVICDTRLATMGYGKRLLAALPPMTRLNSAQEFSDAIERLVTRLSTTDPTFP